MFALFMRWLSSVLTLTFGILRHWWSYWTQWLRHAILQWLDINHLEVQGAMQAASVHVEPTAMMPTFVTRSDFVCDFSTSMAYHAAQPTSIITTPTLVTSLETAVSAVLHSDLSSSEAPSRIASISTISL